MIACSAPPVWPTCERPVPLGDRLEVRADEPLDVVARSPAGSSAASSTTKPARQFSAPQMPNAVVNGSPRSIGRSPGLSRPSVARGPAVSIRWHDSGVPFQPRRRTASRSRHSRAAGRRAGSRTPCDVWQAAYSKAASWSTSLMTRSPSAGIDEQVGRVLDVPGRARPVARSSSTRYGGTLDPVRARRTSSSRRRPTRDPARMPSSRKDLAPAAATGRAAGSAG